MVVVMMHMKQLLIALFLLIGVTPPVDTLAQDQAIDVESITANEVSEKKAFDVGEWFKFRIHYGLVTAGYATLEVTQDKDKSEAYHIKGFGETVGLSRLFFKVEDYYETKIDTVSYTHLTLPTKA